MATSFDVVANLQANAAGMLGAFSNAGVAASGLGGKIGSLKGVAIGAAAGVVGAIAGIGVAAFKIGETFDQAYDTIRVGTGATGQDLENLKANFKNVVSDVPADFAAASTAVADLNTRTGATGSTLETLSKQMLEMSRITDTDVAQNIAATTRVFGDWSIATENQSAALDSLFVVSQATGATVEQLSTNLVKFGAPLRQIGFSLEESTALFGAWEKAGVNSELVMGGLRQALGRIAREGGDPIEVFKQTTEAIKNAGSAGEANTLALELFGARAGPDMAAAIREGRFEIDGLLKTLGESGETILGAAEDTRSFSETWQQFKNQVLVALEPAAAKVFGAIGTLAESLLPAVVPLIEVIGDALGMVFDALAPTIAELEPVIIEVAKAFAELVEALVPLIPPIAELAVEAAKILPPLIKIGTAIAKAIVPPLIKLVEALTPFIPDILAAAIAFKTLSTAIAIIKGVWAAANLVFAASPLGVALVALAGIAFLIWKNWDTVSGWLTTAWNWIKDTFLSVFGAVWDWLQNNWKHLLPILLGPFGLLVDAIISHWDKIKFAFQAAFDFIKGIFEWIVEKIMWFVNLVKSYYEFWINITMWVAQALWNNIVKPVLNIVNKVVEFFRWLVNSVAGTIRKFVSWIWNAFMDVYNAIANWIGKAWDFVTGIFAKIFSFLKHMGGALVALFTGDFSKMVSEVKKALGIRSPSYIEQWMTAIGDNAVENVNRVHAAVSELRSISKGGVTGGSIGVSKMAGPVPGTTVINAQINIEGSITTDDRLAETVHEKLVRKGQRTPTLGFN